MGDHLEFEVRDGIATITINRPERKNAFDFDMIGRWIEALAHCGSDDEVKVVVVTGAGASFCSGVDLDELSSRIDDGPEKRKNELWRLVQRIPLTLEDLDKPVLVAVNGIAIGAGMDLALMGDLRFAAASAEFAETYVRVGLVPGAGGAYFLPRIVGTAKALELFWSGDTINASEALRLGIVNKVLPDTDLLPEVMAVAAKLAQAPPLSVQMIKRAVYQGMRSDLRTSLDMVSSHYAIASTSERHKTELAVLAGGMKRRSEQQ